MEETTNDVRFWSMDVYEGARGTTYTVIWVVAGKRPAKRKPFTSRKAALSFESELRTAHNKGIAFRLSDGLPVTMKSEFEEPSENWYQFTLRYSAMKWKRVSPGQRRNIAESLTDMTEGLLEAADGFHDLEKFRMALRKWAFSARLQGETMPDEYAEALAWVEAKSPSVETFGERKVGPILLRRILDRISMKQDGKKAAPNTVQRKYTVLTNSIAYAIERDLLAASPLVRIDWGAPKGNPQMDPGVCPNEDQALRIIRAVGDCGKLGKRLVAFFASIYYSGLRPEELIAVRDHNLPALVPDEVGEWRLTNAEPRPGGMWTDDGKALDFRELKHRDPGVARTPPSPPELVPFLAEHVESRAIAPGGRVFVGPLGGVPAAGDYGEIFQLARKAALTPDELRRGIAPHPYSLRWARASAWLGSGVSPQQAADWLGHTLAVLYAVYAKVLDGETQRAKELLKTRR